MRFARKNWDVRVREAEALARGEGFRAMRDRIVELADPRTGDVAVDLGCGTGLLALALAPRVATVWAIDSSPAMCDYLRVKAASAGLQNMTAVTAFAASLPLVDGCAQVVVSNYCFHEMPNEEKERALAEVFRVLSPGGRLVIGDMMFSLNPARGRDRRVVAQKVALIARRGLPGLVRLAKNGLRLLLGRWEHPAGAEWWREALARAGFEGIEVTTLAHEGGIAHAVRPPAQAAASEPAGRAALGALALSDRR